MEVYRKLGFKEIANLANSLVNSKEISGLWGDISVNGKSYSYIKNGNQVTIKDEDGMSVTVAVHDGLKEGIDSKGIHYSGPAREVYFEYDLINGDRLTFNKELLIEQGQDDFKEVDTNDLQTGVRTQYIKNGEVVANFSTELTDIGMRASGRTYVFALDGREDPVAYNVHEGNMVKTSIINSRNLSKDAQAAKIIRKSLQLAISKHAINPDAVELVGVKFRQDIAAYAVAPQER